ncbi:MAG: outer membrane protein assembly factor BamB family protein [Actinomycetota bacterium]
MRSRVLVGIITVLVIGTTFGNPSTGVAATAQCASTPSSGGDWVTDGGDSLGTRSQPAETTLSTSNVTGLASKWSFNIATAGANGTLQSIPVEANGCVYVQSSGIPSTLFALNADTGELVWKHTFGAGGCHNTPVINNGIIYVNDSEDASFSTDGMGPHAVALDALTGNVLWVGQTIATEKGTGDNAGCAAPPAYINGLLLIGITNPETDGSRVGGYAIVDATNGAVIKRVHTVPDDEAAAGFGGCSIWSAFEIDPATNFAYTGTAQPSTWGVLGGKDSELCNALIKIDLNQGSPTFGDIVGSMKGTPDAAPYADVDFGTGPTMLHDSSGRQIVAALEKSGFVHAAFTRFMTHAWTQQVAPVGIALGNYTESATDGSNIFTVGAYPGIMYSLSGTTGLPNWATPVPSPFASTSVAYANGVVYYGTETGLLMAVDATHGVPMFAHPIAAEDSGCQDNISGGVSIARHKIFVGCGPVLDVFGL